MKNEKREINKYHLSDRIEVKIFAIISMSEEDYSYELIANESDALICAEVIAKEFSLNNPITKYDRISSECFNTDVSLPLMKFMFNESLSFLVRHQSSNEIIGGLIAGDLYRYHHHYPYDPFSAPQQIAVSDLLDEMDKEFIEKDFGKELKQNLVLHLTVGAVSHRYANQGIATKLNQKLCQYARDQKGFQYAFVQVTNPITKHIYLNKMNGQIVTNIDPTKWIWKKKQQQDQNDLVIPYENYSFGLIPNILIDLERMF